MRITEIIVVVFVSLIGAGTIFRIVGQVGGWPACGQIGTGMTVAAVLLFAGAAIISMLLSFFFNPKVCRRDEKREGSEHDGQDVTK